MKKLFFAAVAALSLNAANAQSYEKGSIYANLVGGFNFGGATDQEDEAGSPKYKYTNAGGVFGLNFQYGIAESFSAGLGLEYGTQVFTYKSSSDASYYNSNNINPTMSLLKVNISGRYYFVNTDKINVYAGPHIGFASGKDKTAYVYTVSDSERTKYSGLNYGVNVGGNFFFTDHFGVTVNLGYDGNSLKSKYTDNNKEYTGKTAINGFKGMAGVAFKF